MDKFNRILKNVVVFLAIFLVVNYLMQSCQSKEEELLTDGNVIFTTTDTEFSRECRRGIEYRRVRHRVNGNGHDEQCNAQKH